MRREEAGRYRYEWWRRREAGRAGGLAGKGVGAVEGRHKPE